VVQFIVALECRHRRGIHPVITGGEIGLFTVTETPALVAVFPDVSAATAVNACAPFAALVVSN
jgi:hypothetical protein